MVGKKKSWHDSIRSELVEASSLTLFERPCDDRFKVYPNPRLVLFAISSWLTTTQLPKFKATHTLRTVTSNIFIKDDRCHPIMLKAMRPIYTNLSPRRFVSTTTRHYATPPFSAGPSPPRLPKSEQEIFDRLQQSSTGAFSTPKPSVVINQSMSTTSLPGESSTSQFNQASQTNNESAISKEDVEIAAVNARIQATGDGEEVHPDVRRTAKPEFEGDRNPKTGETGGPKNDPLRWGGEVDWSYNGRVTDF